MSKQKSKPNRRKTHSPVSTEISPPPPKAITQKTISRRKAKAVSLGGRESKQANLIARLEQPAGATIADLMKVTGWQAHSVRGVMSGALKKRLGLTITSEKGDGDRVYRITPSRQAA